MSATNIFAQDSFDLHPAESVSPQQPRTITKLADNLYRVQNGLYYSIFLVTPEGVIMADPINADTAKWLKAEIKRQFNVPVKYVIYSHNHWDHVAGGEVFADTATFVAQEKAKEGIVRYKTTSAIPQITFSEKMTIALGGNEAELQYYGVNEGMGNSTIYFPKQKTLYVVDWVIFKRLPYIDMAEFNIDGVINSLKIILQKDVNVVSPGHGIVGNKQDIADFLDYMQTLRTEVINNINAGKSLQEARPLIEAKMRKYKDWGMYKEWINMNIDGAYYQFCNADAKCRGNPL